MFLAVTVVGIADIFHPLSVFESDVFAYKGPAAVFTPKQSAVAEHSPSRSGPSVGLLALCQQELGLFPYLFGDDCRNKIFMAELFIRLREAEGLVDLVPFTFVADQSAGIKFILKDAGYHRGLPDIFLADDVPCVGLTFAQELHLHLCRGFALLIIQLPGNGFQAVTG